MILTVTLNPAVDRTLYVEELVLGEVNRVREWYIHPGGKGVNVSRVIRELGGTSLALGFVAGSLGRFVEASLNELGIADDFVHVPGQTRTNTAIFERRIGRHTMLNESGPPVSPHYVEVLRRRLQHHVGPSDWVVLAGSAPPGVPTSVYADFIALCRQAGARTALDADGDLLREGVRARPDLIKPNRREMERLVERSLPTLDAVLAAAMAVHRQGVGIVIVSLGGEGAVAVSAEGAWLVVPPKVPVLSTTGAGDSLLAGVVLALHQGQPLVEGLRLGTAAGAATAMTPGTELCHRADVERLRPLVEIRPLALVGPG